MMTERVGLPRDALGFIRRECPHCHRQFKMRGGPSDGAVIQRHLSRFLLLVNCEELAPAGESLYCIYCGRSANGDEWCTPQQRAWIEKVAGVLAREIRFEQLAFPVRTLRDNPRLTFLPMPPAEGIPEMRSEPDDMVRALFICCVEDVKVESHWAQPIYCPRCGCEHQSGNRRIRMEIAVAHA
jgi:hypothetical protein